MGWSSRKVAETEPSWSSVDQSSLCACRSPLSSLDLTCWHRSRSICAATRSETLEGMKTDRGATWWNANAPIRACAAQLATANEEICTRRCAASMVLSALAGQTVTGLREREPGREV